MKAALEALKLEIVDVLDIMGPPGEAEIERAVQLGQNVARRIKENLG